MSKRLLVILTIILSASAICVLALIILSGRTAQPVEHTVNETVNEVDDPDNTGDVEFHYGDSDRFVNQSDYESAVPEDVQNTVNETVAVDLLSGYPNLRFLSYDPETRFIESENDTYHVTLEYYDAQYTVHAIMLEYYKE